MLRQAARPGIDYDQGTRQLMKRLTEGDVLQILTSSRPVLDVGSGGGLFPSVPRGDVCADIDIPAMAVPDDFIQSDASHLPFRSGTFNLVIAFNVLEHVESPRMCIEEFLRVGSKVICRQDKLLHIPMWATPEHLWLQLPGFRFLPFPRTRLGIRLSVWLRSLVLGKSKLAGLARRLPLWRNWDYYQISPNILARPHLLTERPHRETNLTGLVARIRYPTGARSRKSSHSVAFSAPSIITTQRQLRRIDSRWPMSWFE